MHKFLTCVLPHLLSCACRLSDEDCFVCETYRRCSLLPVSKKKKANWSILLSYINQEKVVQLLSYLVTKTDSEMLSWVLNNTTNQHASPA